MTELDDRAYMTQRHRIGAVLEELVPSLGLGLWELDIQVVRGRLDEGRALAMTSTDWPYRQATLLVSAHSTAMASDRELEKYLLHELVGHVLVAPLYPSGREPEPHERDLIEKVATDLAAAVQMLLDARTDPLKLSIKRLERKLRAATKEHAA